QFSNNFKTMTNITIIGSGTMGNGIAHVFAMNGFNVSLVDIAQPALDKAIVTITKNLDRMVTKGTLTEADKAKTLANIKTFAALQDGAKDADLVVEAASENIEVKLKLFKQLDELCKSHTILAT